MLLKSLFVICFSKFKFYRKLKTCLILSECDPCEKTQITSPNMIIMSSNANPSHRSFLQPTSHSSQAVPKSTYSRGQLEIWTFNTPYHVYFMHLGDVYVVKVYLMGCCMFSIDVVLYHINLCSISAQHYGL